MTKFSMDQIGWSRQMRELGVLLNQSSAEIVTRTARLWLADCVRLTPPTGLGAVFKSPSKQEQAGKTKIRTDINRAFPSLNRLNALKDDSRASRRIGILAARGDYKAISKILDNMHIQHIRVIGGPTVGLHKSLREATTGRPKRKLRFAYQTVRDDRKEQYLAKVLGRLGRAKAGWGKAADKLKVKLPKWAEKHNGKMPGHWRGIDNKDKPVIEFGNGVPYIQDREDKIMAATAKARLAIMTKEVERFWRFAGAGTLAATRSRLKSSAFVATNE